MSSQILQGGSCSAEDLCCDPIITTVPGATGATGAAGADGTDGVNAFTTLTAGFVMPAEGANVVAAVVDSSWMTLGQALFVQVAGYMQVMALPTALSVTLQNLENTASAIYPGNAAPATAIPNGSKVSPGGVTGPAGSTPAGALLAANNLSDVAAVATSRTNLGLGTMAVQNANAVAITGGSIAGITDLAVADGGTGASTAAGARTNLGLGTMAVQNANAIAVTGGTLTGVTNFVANTAGTINSISVGATTPSTGAFTSLSSTGQRTESGIVVQTPSAVQSLLAAGTINPNAAKIRVVGNGAARTLTSTPTISAGAADGQRLLIKGTDAVNTITLQDEGTLPNTTLELGAATRVLALNSQIELSWDSTTSKWCEISFSAN